jgi:cell division protein FtsQ
MFKKPIWKQLLLGLVWVILLGGLVTLMGFIATKKHEVVCKEVKVYIPGSQFFIDKQEIESILEVDRNTLVGHKMDSINLNDLEEKLKANPFIESAKVYTDMDGSINVEITQRKPILRIMNEQGRDYYVDKHGVKLPLSSNFTARVIVANGYIDEPFSGHVDTLSQPIGIQLFKTADYIRKDSLWSAQITQLYVNKDREIELIPRVGNNRILLGDADSLDVKFRNLRAFYKKALPQVGWDTYKLINIKYTNQVIGVRGKNTRPDSLETAITDTAKVDTGSILIKK